MTTDFPTVLKRCPECGGHGFHKGVVNQGKAQNWKRIVFCDEVYVVFSSPVIYCEMCTGYGYIKVLLVQL